MVVNQVQSDCSPSPPTLSRCVFGRRIIPILILIASRLLVSPHQESFLTHLRRRASDRVVHGHAIFSHATSRIGNIRPHNFSHVTCHGSNAYSRVCHFQSVCWDRSERTFVYYRNPSTSHPPAASTQDPEAATAAGNDSAWRASIPGEFVAVGKFGIEQWPGLKRPQDLFLPLIERPGPIPAAAAAFAPEAVHVFFRSFWAENFGHALGDDMLPAFALMSIFGLLTRDVKLLTPNDVAQTCLEAGSSDAHRHARRILRDLAAIMYDHTIGEMSEDPMYAPASDAPLGGGGVDTIPRHTCLTSLLVGHSMTGMAYDGDRYFSAFIDHTIRSAMQQYPSVRQAAEVPLDRQRVVVIEKRGRRALLNAAELAAHIRATFRVQVSVVNPAELKLVDQVAVMLSSTLVVTPPGGISLACAFVRARTPVIFIGYWSPTNGRSELLEGYLWPHVRRIVTLHYKVRRSEVTVLPPGDANRASEWDYQFYGGTSVDLKRMTRLVASGLSVAERELPGLRVPSFYNGELTP